MINREYKHLLNNLFTDGFSTSGYISWSGRLKSEYRIGKHVARSGHDIISDTIQPLAWGTEKTTKNLNHESHCHGRYSNGIPPEFNTV
jgi:hypothetical protein